MPFSPIWKKIPLKKKEHKNEVLERLKAVPVFEDLTEAELKEIEKMCHIRIYKEDEHIFRSGEPGVGMYVILEGNVEIYFQRHELYTQLASLDEGDFFGELALLEETPRTASAIAKNYCRILGFFRPDLLNMMTRKPSTGSKVALNMARLMGRRLIHANEHIESLTASLESR